MYSVFKQSVVANGHVLHLRAYIVPCFDCTCLIFKS